MNFWSDVEKEYNELSGDSQTGEEEDSKLSTPEFNGLLSDIKKDLKRIPKGEVFPSLSSNDVEEDFLAEEDSDQEEGKKSLNTKSKKDKRCRVGDKNYEVGERWKDEKTGKNMICILMNVPKDVQPLLADADILSPSNVGEKESSEWKRPSVEPGWSYTATPIAKQCQEVSKGKTSEKPDKIGLDRAEENNQEGVSQSENQSEKHDKKPEIIVVDSTEPSIEKEINKENNDDDDDGDNESEDESENNEPNDKNDQNEKELKSNKTQKNDTKDNKDSKDDDESDEDSESEIENEEDVKDTKKVNKSEAMIQKSQDNSTNTDTTPTNHDNQSTKDNLTKSEETAEKEGSTPTNTEDGSKSIEGQPPESSDIAQSEKGQPIYTKETVVVQRKLIKTEQTIETTETDKTKQ